jgi:hypothetical protein
MVSSERILLAKASASAALAPSAIPSSQRRIQHAAIHLHAAMSVRARHIQQPSTSLGRVSAHVDLDDLVVALADPLRAFLVRAHPDAYSAELRNPFQPLEAFTRYPGPVAHESITLVITIT